eukprot:gene30335-35330_t
MSPNPSNGFPIPLFSAIQRIAPPGQPQDSICIPSSNSNSMSPNPSSGPPSPHFSTIQQITPSVDELQAHAKAMPKSSSEPSLYPLPFYLSKTTGEGAESSYYLRISNPSSGAPSPLNVMSEKTTDGASSPAKKSASKLAKS